MIRRIASLCLALAVAALIATPAAAKEKIKIVYVEWACATASSNVMKAVIEENLGYDVELTPVSAPAMYAALASGDQDALTTSWLPVTHGDMVKRYQGKIEDLGPNFHGARIGLIVPTYVTIDTVAELNTNAKAFDGEIIGIDPGAGVMLKTEEAMDHYGLDKIELVSSSGAGMTATLANRYRQKKWIAVTGWVPHWKFAKFDLKFLEDPDKVYGEAETINTFARKGLKADHPKVYHVLDAFSWTAAEIGEVMAMNTVDGSDVYENAKKWVAAHPDRVKSWLP
ncbi:glycine betaine ABC transporter substrate-binding protein [Desulfoluna butyratoxydans]|uniref:Abc-type glycine betaine transport system substrate-binding domain n=1 Tax=Desulfoluna butyratoxydans TaxID=231438 RepID=A0A4U8YM99_9BACT|nr:glycine betaine ABC transporter substrate-binding protein [Desulfoluna butyratoxydans]VFQ44830.1 abc-type glycine betaine transport system substrate-binding domain [Desulfoluna butyratoxydans]